MLLKGLMQLEEVRTFDVPVRLVRQGHERIGVGQHAIERGDDGLLDDLGSGGKGFDLHGLTLVNRDKFANSRTSKPRPVGGPGLQQSVPSEPRLTGEGRRHERKENDKV
jgi:hypothetical protein